MIVRIVILYLLEVILSVFSIKISASTKDHPKAHTKPNLPSANPHYLDESPEGYIAFSQKTYGVFTYLKPPVFQTEL